MMDRGNIVYNLWKIDKLSVATKEHNLPLLYIAILKQ